MFYIIQNAAKQTRANAGQHRPQDVVCCFKFCICLLASLDVGRPAKARLGQRDRILIARSQRFEFYAPIFRNTYSFFPLSLSPAEQNVAALPFILTVQKTLNTSQLRQ